MYYNLMSESCWLFGLGPSLNVVFFYIYTTNWTTKLGLFSLTNKCFYVTGESSAAGDDAFTKCAGAGP